METFISYGQQSKFAIIEAETIEQAEIKAEEFEHFWCMNNGEPVAYFQVRKAEEADLIEHKTAPKL